MILAQVLSQVNLIFCVLVSARTRTSIYLAIPFTKVNSEQKRTNPNTVHDSGRRASPVLTREYPLHVAPFSIGIQVCALEAPFKRRAGGNETAQCDGLPNRIAYRPRGPWRTSFGAARHHRSPFCTVHSFPCSAIQTPLCLHSDTPWQSLPPRARSQSLFVSSPSSTGQRNPSTSLQRVQMDSCLSKWFHSLFLSRIRFLDEPISCACYLDFARWSESSLRLRLAEI